MKCPLTSLVAGVFFAAAFFIPTYAQVSMTELNTAIVEDFDSMPMTGSDMPFQNNVWPLAGWYSTRHIIAASNGSSSAGNNYSYGINLRSDRAFGSFVNSITGSLRFGLRMRNDTGMTVRSLMISYTGEQWRSSVISERTLAFDYYQAETADNIIQTKVAFTRVSDLDFTSPVTFRSGTVDGNATENRSEKIAVFSVEIPPGEEILLRWTNSWATGMSSHGLAVDDLSITPRASPTAANVSVGGRVATAGGFGIRNAAVTISGGSESGSFRTRTGTFGLFRFDGLTAGETYIISVNAKKYTFAAPSIVITPADDVTNSDFIALEK